MRWEHGAFVASPVMRSGPLRMVFHSSSSNSLSFIHTSCKKPPTASPLNQRAVGEEHVAEHLAQFTGEGEQGHVSPNTGAP